MSSEFLRVMQECVLIGFLGSNESELLSLSQYAATKLTIS